MKKEQNNMSKGKKTFRYPEEYKMIETSRQYEDQIHRLISNKQLEEGST